VSASRRVMSEGDDDCGAPAIWSFNPRCPLLDAAADSWPHELAAPSLASR